MTALSLARSLFVRVAGLLRMRTETTAAASVLLIGLPAFGTAVAVLAWTGVAIQLMIVLFTLDDGRARRPSPGAPAPPRLRRIDGLGRRCCSGPPIAIALLGRSLAGELAR